MAENGGRLPPVKTQQGFMDVLEDMILPPKPDPENTSPGRMRELKSYILESDKGLESEFKASGMQCKVRNTGLDHIKILNVQDEKSHEFFLDKTDPRFFVLHTNEKSNDTARIMAKLTRDTRYAFDYAWLHSDMLESIVEMSGNRFLGFGGSYSDRHLGSDENNGANIGDLRLNISGSIAAKIKTLVREDPQVSRTCANRMVRIMRGVESSKHGYAQDEVHYNGHFALKRGKSVDDHLALIEMCRKRYSESVESVESLRMGTRRVDGRDLFDGRPFDFEFPNGIANTDAFISDMFSSTAPFNLWGIKTSIADGYFGVMAIDLHTGSPIDFEIADDMMRVYLDKGNCGNTILRLLTNLQMHHDAKDRCVQVD